MIKLLIKTIEPYDYILSEYQKNNIDSEKK